MLQRSTSQFLIAALFGSNDPFKKFEKLDGKPKCCTLEMKMFIGKLEALICRWTNKH